MNNSINTDRPDFEKIMIKVYKDHNLWLDSTSEQAKNVRIALCEKIWTDHVEPLLSTVKRLQEEKKELIEALKQAEFIIGKGGVSEAFRLSSTGEVDQRFFRAKEIVYKALKSSELNKEEQ